MCFRTDLVLLDQRPGSRSNEIDQINEHIHYDHQNVAEVNILQNQFVNQDLKPDQHQRRF
jgi:hypothetical protein